MAKINWKKVIATGTGIAIVVAILVVNIQKNKLSANEVVAMFPLTGKMASGGTEMLQGAQLAVDKWNENGGLLNKPVKLLKEDTKGNPAEAVNIFHKNFSKENKPLAILGVITGVVMNLKPLTEEAGIPLVGAIGANNFLDEPNKYVLRDYPTSKMIGKQIAQHLADKYSNKRIVYFYENTDMSLEIKKIIEENLPKGTNMATFDFDTTMLDFRDLILKSGVNNNDIVVITGLGSPMGSLVRQLREYQYTSEILGNSNLFMPGCVNLAGPAMKNVAILDYISDKNNSYCQKIDAAYQKQYGDKKLISSMVYLSYQGLDTLLAFFEQKKGQKISNLAEEMEGFTHEGCFGMGRIENGELILPMAFRFYEE